MNSLSISQIHSPKPKLSFLDAETKLQHFSIITFYVDPDTIRPLVDSRFDLVTIKDKNFNLYFFKKLKFNFAQMDL